jgi:hypothetical protein
MRPAKSRKGRENRKKRRWIHDAICIQSKKACYEAPQFRLKRNQHCIRKQGASRGERYRKIKIETSEAVGIQSKKACYEAPIQVEAKPALHPEEKE